MWENLLTKPVTAVKVERTLRKLFIHLGVKKQGELLLALNL